MMGIATMSFVCLPWKPGKVTQIAKGGARTARFLSPCRVPQPYHRAYTSHSSLYHVNLPCVFSIFLSPGLFVDFKLGRLYFPPTHPPNRKWKPLKWFALSLEVLLDLIENDVGREKNGV